MGYCFNTGVVQHPGDTSMRREGGRGGGWKVDVFCFAGAAWGDGGTWRKGELWSWCQQLEQDGVTR